MALLRGINVGGKNKIKMGDLRSWVGALGHADVTTYINSGNVVFTARPDIVLGDDGNARIAAEIEERITAESGLRISVLVRSRDQLAAAIEDNPFPDADPSKLIIAFAEDEPDAETVRSWNAVDSGADEVRVHGTVMYLHCPDGLGRSKLGEQLLSGGKSGGRQDRRVPAMTTRNLRTVRKLLDLA